jgi:hypothetical protein
MQLWSINIDIKQLIDYQVVDIHLIYMCNIMKVELLWDDKNKQVSHISESVIVIQIN